MGLSLLSCIITSATTKCWYLKCSILFGIWRWDTQTQQLVRDLGGLRDFWILLKSLATRDSWIHQWSQADLKLCKRCHYPWGQDTEQGSRIERKVLRSNRIIYLEVRLCLWRFALRRHREIHGARRQEGVDGMLSGSTWEVGMSAPGRGCRIQQAEGAGLPGC